MWSASLGFALAAFSSGDGAETTQVTVDLNSRIQGSSWGTYNAGKGIIVRSPFDGLDTSDLLVAPATFWSNDLLSPSQLYPSSGGDGGNCWCPNNGWTGYNNVGYTCDTGPWDYAQMAVVMGTAMPNLFAEYDNIQDSSWDYGVFYATDANSVDSRCFYSEAYSGFDCPGGWVDYNSGTFTPNAEKKGAGNYAAGSPRKNSNWGGGAGCHFEKSQQQIDQTDAFDSNNNNLVDDPTCHCNRALAGNSWGDWVQNWMSNAQPKQNYEFEGWFGQGKAPAWAVDLAACWVENFRDLIHLQNKIYQSRYTWNNQLIPQATWGNDASEDRKYWGWNEIPLDRNAVHDSNNWDAVMVKLPGNLCDNDDGTSDKMDCLSKAAQETLESDLDTWTSAGYLIPGKANLSQKPGSYMVIVREYYDNNFPGWQRHFFCQSWTSPKSKWKIVFEENTEWEPSGACYLDNGGSQKLTV